ncbi:1-deoxy-D-xylulose-5-phosphate reductoisomerase [Neptunicella sp. SCSIO 80796]|uniref:1-deoxy-D-xylulose-5-phosphate reductoisomerase n=1 Tax=Neptunicella plasticusilytica TaxID=3117012 RepID=UPI003A4D464F
MQKITVLGATGSIGLNTLDVVACHADKYQVFALTCHRQVETLIRQAIIHQPEYLVITDPDYYSQGKELARQANVTAEVLAGSDALIHIVEHADVDCVMAAIVGAAGLLPTLSAVKAGKKVLLANKESLVMSGSLFIQEVHKSGALLLPIDSEHNAIFQCLPATYLYGQAQSSGIDKILLTGSGGPFLNTPISELASKTPQQACAHPNWDMGRKISVDSATMMNKGLELIEACWLFGLLPQQIEVVIHPQSVIHSMVQYNDGSVLAQLGNPDMRTPIAHALGYPERIDSGVNKLDFSNMRNFSFEQPDFKRFPNLRLAIEAANQGQYASTALNAANEVAVEAFLQGRISFTDIARLNNDVLQRTSSLSLDSIDAVIEFDQQIRDQAQHYLQGAA